jgi:hypothetical protein
MKVIRDGLAKVSQSGWIFWPWIYWCTRVPAKEHVWHRLGRMSDEEHAGPCYLAAGKRRTFK